MSDEQTKPAPEAWGIYDTQGNCWLGNAEGPVTYRDKQFKDLPGKTTAKLAAEIANERMRTPFRFRAKPYPGSGKLVKRDEITPPVGVKEASERVFNRIRRNAPKE